MEKENFKYFDIHGHINFPEYDNDRDEVIKRAEEKSVFMLTIGTDIESSRKALDLSYKYKNIGACIGYHPANQNEVFDIDTYLEMAKDKKVLAIGEVGLDFFHKGEDTRRVQEDYFVQQIHMANQINKPLMLHVRNGKGINSYQESLKILRDEARVPFNYHFFAGSIEDLKDILDMGGTISFTGVITFTHDYDKLISYVPKDRIMSETDCPYVSPVPHRGKRNEPVFVIEVVKAISIVWGMDQSQTADILAFNARKWLGGANF
jgi:TatD DNase family protein